MTAQQVSSTSEEIRNAAARFIRVVKDASRELGFKAGPAEHLYDAFRLTAAKALVSPEVNKETRASLAALGDPADILAAIFVQKSCVDIPGFTARTEVAGKAFIEAVAAADPMIVVWIAAAVANVKSVSYAKV